MKPEDAFPVFESVFIPEVQSLTSEWLQKATTEELQGLKVMSALLKHGGAKRFRPIHHRTPSNPNLHTSYFEDFHWANVPAPRSDIFKYRHLSDLVYSQIMTPTALQVTQQWLSLRDEDRYVQMLMTLLRSVYSCFKAANTKSLTTHKTSFHLYSQADLVRASHQYRLSPMKKIRASPRKATITKVASLPTTRVNSPLHIVSSGKPGPTLWLNSGVPSNYTSSYQANFKLHYSKFRDAKRPDWHTSMSITLCPHKPSEG